MVGYMAVIQIPSHQPRLHLGLKSTWKGSEARSTNHFLSSPQALTCRRQHSDAPVGFEKLETTCTNDRSLTKGHISGIELWTRTVEAVTESQQAAVEAPNQSLNSQWPSFYSPGSVSF